MERTKKKLFQLKDKAYIINFSLKTITTICAGILLPVACIISCSFFLRNQLNSVNSGIRSIISLSKVLIGVYAPQIGLAILMISRDVRNLWRYMKNENAVSICPLDSVIIIYGMFWGIMMFAISIFGHIMYFINKDKPFTRILKFPLIVVMGEMYAIIVIIVIYVIIYCTHR